jgi:hypothetical protein
MCLSVVVIHKNACAFTKLKSTEAQGTHGLILSAALGREKKSGKRVWQKAK